MSASHSNLIAPFIGSTVKVLEDRCGMKASPQSSYIEDSDDQSLELAAIIGFANETYRGFATIWLREEFFLVLMNKMLKTTYSKITRQVQDAAADLLGAIFENARSELNAGEKIVLTPIPVYLSGKIENSLPLKNLERVVLPFQMESGVFYLHVCMN